MLLNSDAYDACISYFAENLSIFEEKSSNEKGALIADIVSDQVAEMLLVFFQQQTQLSHELRLEVMAEGDRLVDDLEQILGRLWERPASSAQQEFIEEYFLLLKNSLDSQVPHLAS